MSQNCVHSSTAVDDECCECQKCGLVAPHNFKRDKYMATCNRCKWTILEGDTAAERGHNLDRALDRFWGQTNW